MLSRIETPLPFNEASGILLVQCRLVHLHADSEEKPQPGETDPELEDVARRERDYVRQELREELEREPTEEEVDQWLRQHTEGY